MPLKSPYSDLVLPKTNLLTYLSPPGTRASDSPVWINAANPSSNLSPRQMLLCAKRLALGFKNLGINAGQVVSIFTPNHIYVPTAYLATVGSGCIFTGANPVYTVPEMAHHLQNSDAQCLMVHPSLLKTAISAAERAGLSKDRIFLFSDKEFAPLEEIRDWRTIISTADEAECWEWDFYTQEKSSSTVATINYSSGTTGMPKGVMVTHSNLIANIEQTMFIRSHKPEKYHKRTRERWVGFLPLYHAYGQLYTILIACKLEIPVFVMETFQYEPFLRVIQDWKITNLQTAPPILVMLVKRPETLHYDLSSVKEITCGAAPIPFEIKNEVARRFNVQFKLGWGMTELTCTGLSIPGTIEDESGSVGVLLPNMEGKLQDEDGNEVKPGERGEILVRGPNVCLGYWRNPEETRETIDKDGWLKTGDIAIMKENGMFWIVDRKKELIKVNALQVSPAELEAALVEHDGIADAAVVRIALDENEWPRAYVTLKSEFKGKITQQDIGEWIKTRVAKHKWLQGGVEFVDEIPKLASGKIQRKVLHEWSRRDAEIIKRKIQRQNGAKL